MSLDHSWQRFEQGAEADLELFLATASLDQPVRISLTGESWGPRVGAIIASARPGIDLRFVMLRGSPIGDQGIELLAGATALASVRNLGIERCGLTDRGVQFLAQSPLVKGLRELYLCNRTGVETGPLNQIGDAGALALAVSPNLGHLEKLDLWNTSVGDRGFEAIVSSPLLPQLSSMTAWHTRLTREGARRVKAVGFERWNWPRKDTEFPHGCWVHTDYDERIITY